MAELTWKEFTDEVSEFLLKKNPDAVSGPVHEDTDLIREGIVNSFTLTELLLFIEDLTQSEFPIMDVDIDSLRSIRSIYENFIRATGGSEK